MLTAPVDDADPMDQSASEEAEKYLKVFNYQADLPRAIKKAAGYFYTDDRVGFLTYTVADQTRWGTEIPDRKQETYGIPESEGISPETENDGNLGGGGGPDDGGFSPQVPPASEAPSRREVTFVGGKLEWKVPLMADEEDEMGWVRYQHEVGVNLLREKYPWVEPRRGGVSGMGPD